MTHDAMAASLADHLRADRRMVWRDIQLGPAGSPRPDVYAIFKSYVRPMPVAYECKVSVADFRADVTSGKWQSYMPFASGVYFACEAGLVRSADVPESCGLIVRAQGKWRAAKRPSLRAMTIPQEALLKLLIDGVEREGPRYRVRAWSESAHLLRCARQFGDVTARTIRDRLAVEDEIQDRQRQGQRSVAEATRRAEALREEAVKDVGPMRAEICTILGLPCEATRWQMQAAVSSLRASLAEHPAHAKLRRLTASLQLALHRDGFQEADTIANEAAI